MSVPEGAMDPRSGDGLSLLAPFLRVRPEVETLCQFGAQWWAPHERQGGGWIPFHLVAAGHCHLDQPGVPTVPLAAGDVALLPHGGAHTLRGDATREGHVTPLAARPLVPLVRHEHNGAVTMARATDGDRGTELICGRLRFEGAPDVLPLATLPPLIVIRAAPAMGRVGAGGGEGASVATLLRMMQGELVAARAGAAAVAADLAGAVLILALRAHFDTPLAAQGGQDAHERSILTLLADRRTARLTTSLLRDPAHPWTLDGMAAVAATSRATLVRLFRVLTGQAPMAVLAGLRLDLARHRLMLGDGPLIDVAMDVGYQSESAFSRAFHRRFGVAPGTVRRGRGVFAAS